ncbi:MAG TPA: hypothetical protein VGL56_10280 [Fimbriimonadaceae bacterium]|jgi:hypothetical protein
MLDDNPIAERITPANLRALCAEIPEEISARWDVCLPEAEAFQKALSEALDALFGKEAATS